jgi:RNA polymerase sigma factor (sigma-70 family)
MAIAHALARSTDGERAPSLDEPSKAKRFEQLFVAHLDSAYDLARWLTRDERNAEDVVQEACLRAFKFLDGFHGENARVWLLAIVRNTFYSWLRKNQSQALNVPLDEDGADGVALEFDGGNPVDELLQQKDARRLINGALEQLPAEFREVIVLRELEDLSYKEIAAVADIPIGTVMSRLARARKLLLQHLQHLRQES